MSDLVEQYDPALWINLRECFARAVEDLPKTTWRPDYARVLDPGVSVTVAADVMMEGFAEATDAVRVWLKEFSASGGIKWPPMSPQAAHVAGEIMRDLREFAAFHVYKEGEQQKCIFPFPGSSLLPVICFLLDQRFSPHWMTEKQIQESRRGVFCRSLMN